VTTSGGSSTGPTGTTGTTGTIQGPAADEVPMLVIRMAKSLVERMVVKAPDGSSTGFTMMHALAARFVDAQGGATTVEIAAHLGITKQSASELVQALEAVDVVERRPHPDDRRARIVALTPYGAAKLAASRDRWAALEAEWATLVEPGALDLVRRTIEAYLDANPPGLAHG